MFSIACSLVVRQGAFIPISRKQGTLHYKRRFLFRSPPIAASGSRLEYITSGRIGFGSDQKPTTPSQWLEERFRFNDDEIAKIVGRAPCINTVDVLKQRADRLKDQLNLKGSELCRMIQKQPTILTSIPEKNSKPKPMKIVVPVSAKGMRLDVFLVNNFEGHPAPYNLSRTRIKTLISEGCIKMPKRHKAKTSQILQGNEEILLNLPVPVEASYEGEHIPLDIVYEDDHMVVLYKPAGMVVHPAKGNPTGTLVNALLYHCGDSLKGISGVKQPGIVHRLDKQTQGLMMAAKTEEAHKKLSDMLTDHVIDRRYLALVWHPFEESKGTVNAPIGTDFHDRQKMAIHKKGRNAVTHYTVLQQTKQLALVECKLETGRTHQIRLHMAHLGHQVLGDELYGNMPEGLLQKEQQHFLAQCFGPEHGHALASCYLKLDHPITHEEMAFRRELPDNFKKILNYFF